MLFSVYSIIGIYSHSDIASVRFTGQTKPHQGENRQRETALPESINSYNDNWFALLMSQVTHFINAKKI